MSGCWLRDSHSFENINYTLLTNISSLNQLCCVCFVFVWPDFFAVGLVVSYLGSLDPSALLLTL